MKLAFSSVLALSAALVLGTAGCKKQSATANSTTQLDAPTQAVAAATAAPLPAQQINDALAAYKKGNLLDSVTQLQQIKQSTPMTGAQLLDLNRSINDVINDLYARAAKGDAQAQQAIEAYKNTHHH